MKINYYNRSQSGKFKRVTWFRFFLCAGVLTFAYFVIPTYKSFDYTAVESVHAEPTLEAKIDALKQDVLNTLAECESRGDDGVVIVDSNDYLSWGKYQWQRKSVQHYYNVLYGEDIDLREAGLIALDGHDTVKLDDFTKQVIFETESGVAKDWVNCSKKHGLQVEVDIIKKLEV